VFLSFSEATNIHAVFFIYNCFFRTRYMAYYLATYPFHLCFEEFFKITGNLKK